MLLSYVGFPDPGLGYLSYAISQERISGLIDLKLELRWQKKWEKWVERLLSFASLNFHVDGDLLTRGRSWGSEDINNSAETIKLQIDP